MYNQSSASDKTCLNINQLNNIKNEDGGKVFVSQKPAPFQEASPLPFSPPLANEVNDNKRVDDQLSHQHQPKDEASFQIGSKKTAANTFESSLTADTILDKSKTQPVFKTMADKNLSKAGKSFESIMSQPDMNFSFADENINNPKNDSNEQVTSNLLQNDSAYGQLNSSASPDMIPLPLTADLNSIDDFNQNDSFHPQSDEPFHPVRTSTPTPPFPFKLHNTSLKDKVKTGQRTKQDVVGTKKRKQSLPKRIEQEDVQDDYSQPHTPPAIASAVNASFARPEPVNTSLGRTEPDVSQPLPIKKPLTVSVQNNPERIVDLDRGEEITSNRRGTKRTIITPKTTLRKIAIPLKKQKESRGEKRNMETSVRTRLQKKMKGAGLNYMSFFA